MRGTLISIEIADLHFGVNAINPAIEYQILEEQFLNKIQNIPFDFISINGDTFEHKFMSNSDAVSYAIKFIDNLVWLCRSKGATLLILAGTYHHDAGQLSLFYHYLEDKSVDVRIIEEVKFEYVKGSRILCIPELYNRGKEYYENFLYRSGMYDSVRLHGTIVGSVYGANEENLDSQGYPVFGPKSFINCCSTVIGGHVHTPGCFHKYMYYCGSPLRFAFGQEEAKGFIILLHNLDTQEHYVHFEEITSFRYDTINLDHMINYDPKDIIAYLKNLQAQGIHNIKVVFTQPVSDENISVLKSFYRNNSSVKFDIANKAKDITYKATEEKLEQYKEYNYIFDPALSEYEILTRYINDNKGYQFITTDQLINIVRGII